MALLKTLVLDDLPDEMIIMILQRLDNHVDIATFASTSHHYRRIFQCSRKSLPRFAWQKLSITNTTLLLKAQLRGFTLTFELKLGDEKKAKAFVKRRLMGTSVMTLLIHSSNKFPHFGLLRKIKVQYDTEIHSLVSFSYGMQSTTLNWFLSCIQPKELYFIGTEYGVVKIPKSLEILTTIVANEIDFSEAADLRQIRLIRTQRPAPFLQKIIADPTFGVLSIDDLDYTIHCEMVRLEIDELPDRRHWKMTEEMVQTRVGNSNVRTESKQQTWLWQRPKQRFCIKIVFSGFTINYGPPINHVEVDALKAYRFSVESTHLSDLNSKRWIKTDLDRFEMM